jgi:hypothetical protein
VSLTIPREDLGKLRIDRLPVADALAQEFIDFFFTAKRWTQDHEHTVRFVQRWRLKAYNAALAAQHAPRAPLPDRDATLGQLEWAAKCRAQARANPQHWTVGRLAAAHKQSRAAVEAVLASVPAGA